MTDHAERLRTALDEFSSKARGELIRDTQFVADADEMDARSAVLDAVEALLENERINAWNLGRRDEGLPEMAKRFNEEQMREPLEIAYWCGCNRRNNNQHTIENAKMNRLKGGPWHSLIDAIIAEWKDRP